MFNKSLIAKILTGCLIALIGFAAPSKALAARSKDADFKKHKLISKSSPAKSKRKIASQKSSKKKLVAHKKEPSRKVAQKTKIDFPRAPGKPTFMSQQKKRSNPQEGEAFKYLGNENHGVFRVYGDPHDDG